jgi:hypothetical protein
VKGVAFERRIRKGGWCRFSAMLLAASCGGPDREAGCDETAGVACVWAGTGEPGFNGDGHHRLASRLYWPVDLEFAPDDTPWVLDWNNHKLRRVLTDGTFETMVGEFVGDGPPDASDLQEPGAPGLTVRLNHPTDVQFDDRGRLLIAAWHNHKIRRLDPATGRVVVLGGRGPGYAGDGGPVEHALFNQPKALVRASDGTLFVLDQRNFRVRKIGPDGQIETAVGTGKPGSGGDAADPRATELDFEAGGNPEPSGALALDTGGRMYIADGLNHVIRRVDLSAGRVDIIAGTGVAGFSGDGGPALAAQLNNVRDLELGPDGRLYLADTENHRVRAIDLEAGTIDTVAGGGTQGDLGDGVTARQIALSRPMGIAFDHAGALYVSDTFNSRIIKVVP